MPVPLPAPGRVRDQWWSVRRLRRLQARALGWALRPRVGGTVVAAGSAAALGATAVAMTAGLPEALPAAAAAVGAAVPAAMTGRGFLRWWRRGRERAGVEALATRAWEDNTLRVGPRATLVDAPNSPRWRFASLYREIRRLTATIPRGRRRLLLREARAVAGRGSQLLLDGEAMGQAYVRVSPEGGWAGFVLRPDDTHVAGAHAAYQSALDQCERQLVDLCTALREAHGASRAWRPDAAAIERLMTLVGLRELARDPLLPPVPSPLADAAERLRAETAARRELEDGG